VVALALVLALVGPPKLPPLPGRGLPAPEPAPQNVAPKESPAPAAKPTAPPVPSAPAPTVAPETKGEPEPAATKPANPPSAPAPTAPTIGPARAPDDDTALRVVDSGEVERWAAEDRRRAAALDKVAKPEVKPKPQHEGPVLRTASEEVPPERLSYRRRPHPPKRSAAFVLGYRYFRIHDALQRPQDWHLASLEVSPLRRFVRLNLITEFGVEGGEAARAGDRADMMLLERVGLGMQYPHFVTPLVEFQAGVGGARVELFQRNDVAFLYTLGLDAGAQFAVTKWMYIHAVVGWIRPTFRWPNRSASYDRVTFKVGVGF
jgi:hypothetical protein